MPIPYYLISQIEDIICWNLSFGVSIEDTLLSLDRMDLINYFENFICD
jgi:hypothetical protein